jgi:hypothetical protein
MSDERERKPPSLNDVAIVHGIIITSRESSIYDGQITYGKNLLNKRTKRKEISIRGIFVNEPQMEALERHV